MRWKGNFADISRVLPEVDEACVRVCACVCMYMGEVSMYIEAKGTAEKIFLVLTLVPVFSRHFFVPVMCRKVYTSVWGVQ